jgi:hypothetical protein
MTKKKPLEWYATEDGKYLGYPDCERCMEKISDPALTHAAASVGIEHGKSTGKMIKIVIDEYHAQGHPDE